MSKAGQARVRRDKAKNVHAYLKGEIAKKGAMGSDGSDAARWPAKIEYNPYRHSHFTCSNLTAKPFEVHAAMAAVVSTSGVFAAYLN